MNKQTNEPKDKKQLALIVSIFALVIVLVGASFVYRKFFSKPELSSLKLLDKADRLEAPDFTVYDQDGQPVQLSDYSGRPIVLNFWASWCPPCKIEMPHFQNQYDLNKEEDIVFLMVNTIGMRGETVESAAQFIQDNGYSFPVHYDTAMDAAQRYGVSGIPVTYFIGADGMIISGVGGTISEDMLADGITALLHNM